MHLADTFRNFVANYVLPAKEDGPKYKLVEDKWTTTADGTRLYRIKALRRFDCGNRKVRIGDLGGYVASEQNLSHDDTCWIFDDAQARDNSRVNSNAYLAGRARISDGAVVCGCSVVCDDAQVRGGLVCNYSLVCDRAVVARGRHFIGVFTGTMDLPSCSTLNRALVSGDEQIFGGNARGISLKLRREINHPDDTYLLYLNSSPPQQSRFRIR